MPTEQNSKYYLDLAGVKALMEKSVELFDKSKNYIWVNLPGVLTPPVQDSPSPIPVATFMHKDLEIGGIESDSGIAWRADDEGVDYGEKYGDIFDPANVNKDMFVRFTMDGFAETGEKVDVICHYVETRPSTNQECYYLSGEEINVSMSTAEDGYITAVFEGLGPNGETYQFLYLKRKSNDYCWLGARTLWKEVEPILITTLMYQDTDVEDSYVGVSLNNPNEHAICGKFIALTNWDQLEIGAEHDFDDDRGFHFLYNMKSGEYDNRGSAPDNMGYAGFISDYTFIKNITKSRVRLNVDSNTNEELTGFTGNTTIDLYYAGSDWGDAQAAGLLAKYTSADIPTADGGHIYITLEAYCKNDYHVITGGNSTEYSNPLESMGIHFQKSVSRTGGSTLLPTLKVCGHRPLSASEIQAILNPFTVSVGDPNGEVLTTSGSSYVNAVYNGVTTRINAEDPMTQIGTVVSGDTLNITLNTYNRFTNPTITMNNVALTYGTDFFGTESNITIPNVTGNIEIDLHGTLPMQSGGGNNNL